MRTDIFRWNSKLTIWNKYIALDVRFLIVYTQYKYFNNFREQKCTLYSEDFSGAFD